MTLLVVKKSEREFAEALGTEWGFLTTLCKVDDQPLQLEAYQLRFLRDRSRFRWVNKSRQVGYSFLLAMEALARCHLRSRYTSVIVSYNLSDSKEKILIARQLYEDMPLAFQKKLISDSKTELAFASNGPQQQISRIISNPSRAPRGKKGDIYLDELAHYATDAEVYRGSTALILRGGGQLTGCSTPLGRRGVFYEIASQATRRYPHHSRQNVPWWLCRSFSTDTKAAALEAPSMTTEERVRRFGRSGIVEQFDSLPLDDFAQEFECNFVDESFSYYPYDLILPCTSDEVVVREDVSDIRRTSGRIVAGFDVGRTRDRSELAVFEQKGDRFVCLLLRSFDQVTFAAQEAELRRLLNILPVARLSIDSSGLGMNLAENLAREFPQVVPENFSSSRKEQWAVDFKILLQRREVALPKDRKLVSQIHSIKRQVLPSGKVSFDADKTVKNGHADRFWAVALACQKERGQEAKSVATIAVRILGTDSRGDWGRLW